MSVASILRIDKFVILTPAAAMEERLTVRVARKTVWTVPHSILHHSPGQRAGSGKAFQGKVTVEEGRL